MGHSKESNPEFSFCKFSEDQVRRLNEAFSTVFSKIDTTQISDAYQGFREDFYNDNPRFTGFERSGISFRTENLQIKEFFQNIQCRACIDLPSLIEPAKSNGKLVFLVAQEPLTECDCKEVIIGTPFGLHIKSFREGCSRVYWEIVINILKQGYSVYISDVKKVWLSESENKRRKIVFPKDANVNFLALLQKEIEIFEPEFIITFGKLAELSAQSLTSKAKLIPILHPSANANKAWLKLLGKDRPCTVENKVLYIDEQFNLVVPGE